jgi:hypothetical protein
LSTVILPEPPELKDESSLTKCNSLPRIDGF